MKVQYQFYFYSFAGMISFACDLLLLALFIEILNWNYLFSTIIAFIISVIIQYFILRKTAFKESIRSHTFAYSIFLTLMSVSLLAITGLMYLAVSVFGFHYFTSRIIVAGFIGIINFFLHKKVTFSK